MKNVKEVNINDIKNGEEFPIELIETRYVRAKGNEAENLEPLKSPVVSGRSKNYFNFQLSFRAFFVVKNVNKHGFVEQKAPLAYYFTKKNESQKLGRGFEKLGRTFRNSAEHLRNSAARLEIR